MNGINENIYTLFWLGGKKEFITGETIEQAFTAAGYGGGAAGALDFYNKEADDSYFWDTESKKWVKRTALHIHQQDLPTFTEVELVQLFERHGTILLDFEDKDQLVLKRDYGRFGFGDVHPHGRPFYTKTIKYIEVVYGEYIPEGYGEDDDRPCYMAAGSQYFHHDDVVNAITCFVTRGMDDSAKHCKVKMMEGTVSLDEIAERQDTLPL